jgi:hypothetical protein
MADTDKECLVVKFYYYYYLFGIANKYLLDGSSTTTRQYTNTHITYKPTQPK